jgi:hypothetical protein
VRDLEIGLKTFAAWLDTQRGPIAARFAISLRKWDSTKAGFTATA